MLLLPPPRGRLDDDEPFQPDIMRRVDGAAAAGRREYAAAATTAPHVFPSPLSAGAGTRRPAGTDPLAKPSARTPTLPPTRHASEPPRGEAAPATCNISQPQAATSASTTRLRPNACASQTADRPPHNIQSLKKGGQHTNTSRTNTTSRWVSRGFRATQAAALRVNLNVQGCGIVAPPMHASSRTPLLLPLLLSHNLPTPRVH